MRVRNGKPHRTQPFCICEIPYIRSAGRHSEPPRPRLRILPESDPINYKLFSLPLSKSPRPERLYCDGLQMRETLS